MSSCGARGGEERLGSDAAAAAMCSNGVVSHGGGEDRGAGGDCGAPVQRVGEEKSAPCQKQGFGEGSPCHKQGSPAAGVVRSEFEEDYALHRTIRLLLSGAALWAAVVYQLRAALDAGHLPLLARLGTAVWNPRFWVPNNLTWVTSTASPLEPGYYARPIDALYSISVALLILAFRFFYARYVARPIGRRLRLKERRGGPRGSPLVGESVEQCAQLERVYSSLQHGKPSADTVAVACRATGLDANTVRNWLRRRRNRDKPTVMDKWCEGSFKFLYYFTVFWGALGMLWGKEWFHDRSPHSQLINVCTQIHVMEWDVFCYYQLVLGFYWSLCISQFMDVRRKDFWQMFVHHIITILLLTTSFSGGWHRIGALVIVTHDFSDWTLEIPKNAHYCGRDWLVVASFPLLWVGWIGSRLIYYPLYVISIPALEAPHLIGDGGYSCPYVLIASALLSSLLVMHCFWFYYITMSAVNILRGDAKDERSCSEADSPAAHSPTPPTSTQLLANGDATPSSSWGNHVTAKHRNYVDKHRNDVAKHLGAGDQGTTPASRNMDKCNGSVEELTGTDIRKRRN